MTRLSLMITIASLLLGGAVLASAEVLSLYVEILSDDLKIVWGLPLNSTAIIVSKACP